MLGIGVVGYGYWGPNMVRNFNAVPDAQVKMVSDLSTERLAVVQRQYPWVETTQDYQRMIASTDIDAVVIATPVFSHFEIAMQALQAGKHVLVEKPMTTTVDEGSRLIDEAQKRGLTLMVDHTFVYMGAVQKIRELVASGELGEIYYFDSTRVNLGLFQHDVNVVFDLAVHDLSIMDYVFDGIEPRAVSVTAKNHVPNQPENTAYLTLFFNSNMIGHLNVNWLSPVKMRQMLIGGSKKMIVFDDLAVNEKIKVYDAGITINDPNEMYETMLSYRMGDVWSPRFDHTEALYVEALHFCDCIRNNKEPLTGGEMGLRVVRVLEKASQSIAMNGRPVDIR